MEDIKNKENKDSDMFHLTPADRIKYLAKAKNVYLKDIAKYLNVDQATIVAWLSRRELPPLNRINQIADFLDTDVRFIVTGRHEITFSEFPEEDKAMMKNYYELSETRKAEIREYIKILLDAEKSDNQMFKVK